MIEIQAITLSHLFNKDLVFPKGLYLTVKPEKEHLQIHCQFLFDMKCLQNFTHRSLQFMTQFLQNNAKFRN